MHWAWKWLGGLFAPLLLVLLGWQGWAQWQRATAPVVSIAEDGTIRVNGREFAITADGLPPKALEELEGGPPVELPWLLMHPEDKRAEILAFGLVWRDWHYPRLGLTLRIMRGTMAQSFSYQGCLFFDDSRPATVALRGQQWWLGWYGPFARRPTFEEVTTAARPGEHPDRCSGWWTAKQGGTEVHLQCPWRNPLSWLGSADWTYRLRLTGYPLQSASVYTPWVAARSPSTWPPEYGEYPPPPPAVTAAPAPAAAATSAAAATTADHMPPAIQILPARPAP